ncbi:MAG TPA: histidine phosphatase family protein [Hypericibacter adhaerens]|uniref:Phosphoglycerate mutase n=1 Tax=Hypericibacter adhaerens TaxID=2602016 RepID=A0A5J6N0D1_9PROT|nr:histidine phosphatase family protein [Hypericibacter adhaerens]QEX23131.1 phosphoglycerate mutase [Hypericibacter adhaerens]HWA45029.1 histidine phosphatase family protein [Hypericibacter adhaerens]
MPKPAPRSRQGTMKRLYLLRHTKSSWKEDDLSDHERPLAPRGRRAAPPIGVYLRDHAILPDLVLASSARRTRETWELVSLMLPKPPDVLYEDKLYLADAAEIMARLRKVDHDVDSVLIVGHNPGLQELAERLFGDGDAGALAKLTAKFPTGGLALYQFDIERWDELVPGIGKLTDFVVPRDLV